MTAAAITTTSTRLREPEWAFFWAGQGRHCRNRERTEEKKGKFCLSVQGTTGCNDWAR
jgi:hypothetical protein